MPDPTTLASPKQLLVEGRDAVEFFAAFNAGRRILGLQVQNFGGITQLRPFLKAFVRLPAFQAIVQSVAIVRDAETDPIAAFQSVCSSLEAAGLPSPSAPGVVAPGSPSMVVYLLPDPHTPGMLESLCLRALANDLATDCVHEFLSCVEHATGVALVNPEKARLHAFLASRPKPGLLLGQAARAGYLSLNDDVYSPLNEFLRQV
jgi:hypothetical protein